MNRYRSSAVVLRRWPYSESSLIVRVLTPERGVVSLFAKGVQRPKSGRMGVLDTWALVDLEYGGPERAELWSLYEADLLNRFSGISFDPAHLIAAGLVAELAELAAPPGLPSGPVFLYLLQCLEQLDRKANLSYFLPAAILEALSLLGLDPEIGPDSEHQTDERWFSIPGGGLLPVGAVRPQGQAYRLSPRQQALLRGLRQDPDQIEGHPEDLSAILTILREFLSFHLERPPKALSLLRSDPEFGCRLP